MSTRQIGFGLSRELAEKNAAKYSIEDEAEIVEWIVAITGTENPEATGPEGFKNFLKSGFILCNLINSIKPGLARKPHDTSKVKMAALRQNKETFKITQIE